ncbi:sensor histidine kinase [Streptomyces sp. NPDC020800]|uniref:sensor histidine kinase n=1 Tax=Streptomyces sp. NPDC020800 TaxID=3365092 RepID=UPI0037BCD358
MEVQRTGRVARSAPRVLSAPWSVRTWLIVLHVLSGLPIGLVTIGTLLLLGGLAAGLALTWVAALPVLAALFWCSRQFAELQHARFAALLNVDLVVERSRTEGITWSRRVTAEVRTATTWRRLGYHVVSSALGLLGSVALVAFWVAGLALSTVYLGTTGIGGSLPYVLGLHQALLVVLTLAGICVLPLSLNLARGLALVDVALARNLLGPSPRHRMNQLSEQVLTLTEARAQVVEATDSERRRIERDLHDGVQQQLVSMSMNLGITRKTVKDMPEPAREPLAQVHEQAKQSLADLRQLVRGLHPAVLDDLGLDAALSGIVARSPVPASLHVDLHSIWSADRSLPAGWRAEGARHRRRAAPRGGRRAPRPQSPAPRGSLDPGVQRPEPDPPGAGRWTPVRSAQAPSSMRMHLSVAEVRTKRARAADRESPAAAATVATTSAAGATCSWPT